MMDRMAPGGGGRFAALEHKLAGKPGITNPGALAAKIGREKYGKARFQKMAAAGRKRHMNETQKAIAKMGGGD